MSPREKPLSAWKMLLAGRASVAMKRLFLVILVVVSLVVWAITIIGLGILRRDGSAAGVVQSAKASSTSPSAGDQVSRERRVEQAAGPSVGEAEPVVQEAVPAAVAESIRNPFLADDQVFPSLRTGKAADDLVRTGVAAAEKAKQATPEEIEAIRQLVESMMLMGTVASGLPREAVIDGWTLKLNGGIRFKINGRSESLVVMDIRDCSVTLSAMGKDFVLKAPILEATLLGGQTPMAMIDGLGYGVGDRLKKVVFRAKLGSVVIETAVKVKEIRNQSVILSARGTEVELAMRKGPAGKGTGAGDGERSGGPVRATVEKE
ncbi:MAG: hypothetical protein GWP05_09075 [Anaerolineaceae bacterium]|nr:hypothetical protein [Anaerolineaceae bacterium]